MTDWRDETRWQPLGAIVQRLKRKVESAYHHCDEDTASEAHDDLTAAEWRLRSAERLKERNTE